MINQPIICPWCLSQMREDIQFDYSGMKIMFVRYECPTCRAHSPSAKSLSEASRKAQAMKISVPSE